MVEQGPLQRAPRQNCLLTRVKRTLMYFWFHLRLETYAWSEMEKRDRLYESLKGKAMWYVCSLPRALTGN